MSEDSPTIEDLIAKGELIPVTLHLTPAAHGLLVAMAAADGHPDVEECIQHQLAADVSCWMESIGDTPYAESLFLRGSSTKKRAA